MKPRLTPAEDFDQVKLDREMDRVKALIFLDSKNPFAVFFSNVLFSLEIVWTNEIPYAATDYRYIFWNPNFFARCSRSVSATILMHEIMHVAYMHGIRKEDRIHKLWNIACDIRINNDLDKLGYSFDGVRPWIKHIVDKTGKNATEEEIYDLLMSEAIVMEGGNSFGDEKPDGDDHWGDIFGDLSEEEKHAAIRNIIICQQQTEMAGAQMPGDIEEVITKFLKPVVPWERTFQQFFTDLIDCDFSWRRPNRRHQDIYLPSMTEDEGRLEHILYVLDVSGSITGGDKVRFNSELKYVWDELKPKKMTIIQFDDEIKKEIVIEEGDNFDYLEITGGGGTNLQPVREWIIANRPTVGCIFSDLECEPMDCTDIDIPLIWICVNNRDAQVEKGRVIHIR